MSDGFAVSAAEAVQEVMVRLRDAWQRGDGKAYAELFSEDAQYVTAPGERLHGRESIALSHEAVFHTFFRETRLGRSYRSSLRPLAPDVVLVESEGSVLFPGENETRVPANGLMTLVMVRKAEGWRIASFQNTPTGRFRSVRFIARYFLSRLRRAIGK